MDLGKYYTKLSKSNREKQILHVITYMWNLKNKTSEYNKKETDSQTVNKLVVTSGEREGGGARQGYGIKRYKLLFRK